MIFVENCKKLKKKKFYPSLYICVFWKGLQVGNGFIIQFWYTYFCGICVICNHQGLIWPISLDNPFPHRIPKSKSDYNIISYGYIVAGAYISRSTTMCPSCSRTSATSPPSPPPSLHRKGSCTYFGRALEGAGSTLVWPLYLESS